jgi:uncharacterized oligopeptide transporter (OPT) family protein
LRDLAAARSRGQQGGVPRTDRDLPIWVTLAGSFCLLLAMMAIPGLGLGFSWHGLLGAALIVLFGFLFVTVSSRLTGEIGSSSNPISGMTVATLLFTCLIFLLADKTDKAATLSALTIAAIVCIASSNGGTTAQDLKTGYLVGATPINQQLAIVIGAVTSALVIGGTLLLLNSAGTVYSKRNLPAVYIPRDRVEQLTTLESPGGEYADNDHQRYHVLNAAENEYQGVPAGRYLIDDQGQFRYYVDPAINGRLETRDDGTSVKDRKFSAPKAQLMNLIIKGILNRQLPWGLVIVGVLIAVTLELSGVPSLPFAVGVYLPITASAPIFCGGIVRWLVEKRSVIGADLESSPGVLMASGYIAGGTIAGVLAALSAFMKPEHLRIIDFGSRLPESWHLANWPAAVAFTVLAVALLVVGFGRMTRVKPEPADAAP